MSEPSNYDKLRAYLLGQRSEDTAEFEKDPVALEAAEEELLDDYVRGRLNARDAHVVELEYSFREMGSGIQH